MISSVISAGVTLFALVLHLLLANQNRAIFLNVRVNKCETGHFVAFFFKKKNVLNKV